MFPLLRTGITAILLFASLLASAADSLSVYTVNYPLAYFTQRIGAEHVEVILPMPPDIDPAFWQPGAEAIAGFQQADLILLNGADYAKWLKRASLPRRKMVNTSAAFMHALIRVEESVTHQHGPGGEHSHAGTAFTTWLDFNQAIMQAKAIMLALEKKQPQNAGTFRRNFAALEKDLLELDQALMAVATRNRDSLFVASHPVYQYLARRYNIRLKSVMWEPDVIPDETQWHELARLLDTHNANWMIWEGQPEPQSVARLQQAGGKSLVFSPAAKMPSEGDFIAIMKNNITALEKAYD